MGYELQCEADRRLKLKNSIVEVADQVQDNAIFPEAKYLFDPFTGSKSCHLRKNIRVAHARLAILNSLGN